MKNCRPRAAHTPPPPPCARPPVLRPPRGRGSGSRLVREGVGLGARRRGAAAADWAGRCGRRIVFATKGSGALRAARPAAARRGAMSGTVTVAVLPLLPTQTKFQVYPEDLRRCRRRAAGPGSAAACQSPRQAPAVPLPPSTGTRPPHTPCTPP